MRPPTGTRRTAVALTALGGVLVTTGLIGLGGQGASASSHREAPVISGLPQYDNTDTYAFTSPDRRKKVTMIANWLPFSEPAGGPNFYAFATDARYNIKVDNDGDATPERTFQWTFKNNYRTKDTFLYNTGAVTSINDPDLNFYQTFTLKKITPKRTSVMLKNGRVAPSFVGDASMPDYAKLRDQAMRWNGPAANSGRVYAGQAEDPFFLDLRVFDLLYGGDLSEVGDDTLAGFNVNTVALQINKKALAKGFNQQRNPIVGIWSTTDRRAADGSVRQVSRLGAPLVNEVVIPLKDKDRFNASQPSGDAQFLDYVTKPELPQLIEAIYGIPAPDEPRDDLVSVFLTGVDGLNQPEGVAPSEQLRLNMSTPVSSNPNRLGVIGGDNQGYPNGRRLGDDVVDISLQVVEGELVGNPNDLGDGVNTNDVEFGDTFPYVALPTSGSDTTPHNGSTGATPLTGGNVPTNPTAGPSALPVLPLSAIAFGLLVVAGGVVVWTKRPTGAPSAA